MIKLIPGTLYPINSSMLEYVETNKELDSVGFKVGAGYNHDNFEITEAHETDSTPGLICFKEATILKHISKRLDGHP